MVIKKLTYLGLVLCSVVLTGCSDDIAIPNTLSGDGTKTPLSVTALLDANASQTRAADMSFAQNDELLAYIRHVKWDGSTGTRESIAADKAPILITFKKKDNGMEAYSGEDISPIGLANKVDEYDRHLHLTNENTQQTSGLINDLGVGGGHIYWDDFSETAADKNLHTANHYLQSYYGYCYNGGTPTETLEQGDNKINGVIKWAVLTDQSGTTEPTNFKKSDLLWSAEQTPVRYEHKATIDDNTRQGLVLPYTHAMSKVTINVIAGNGFESTYKFQNLDGTKKTRVELFQVRTTCTAKAPTAELDCASSTKANVKMMPGDVGTTDSKPSRPFSAIIVPSVLTIGNQLATISDMDGNEYFIYVTDAIIKGWKQNNCLTETDEENNGGTAQARPMTRADENHIDPAKGYEMKSGVHYILNVKVDKTEVTVSAVIRDWNEVEAEGKGTIYFNNDVSATGDIQEELKAHGFDIYKSTTTTFGAKATTVRWNKANGEWRYNPAIYWNGEAEYFRALSNAHTDTPGTPENESLHLDNGRDVLWGTTKDTDHGYAEGVAIAPRTGDVPLTFYHAMSKITFNLQDAAGANDPQDSKLDLSRATIQLTNLATGGTIDLNEGFITSENLDKIVSGQKAFSEDNGAVPKRMGYYAANDATVNNPSLTLKDYYFTPQAITDDVMLIITLANGTTYKTQLNTCRSQNGVDGSGNNVYTPVTEWKRNTNYVYTITLAKDTIEFRAEIKEWDEVEASGTITPEW